jgi:hypothetical protein
MYTPKEQMKTGGGLLSGIRCSNGVKCFLPAGFKAEFLKAWNNFGSGYRKILDSLGIPQY